jgi:hypothetical protein
LPTTSAERSSHDAADLTSAVWARFAGLILVKVVAPDWA